MYRIEFLSAAERYFKKLRDKNLVDAFKMAVEKLSEDPYIGKAKRGDLSSVYGYDFRHAGATYEIAYKIYEDNEELVVIILAGTRENFYEALKLYIKTTQKSLK